jgi:GNAT superfamily N-acetyltransferase
MIEVAAVACPADLDAVRALIRAHADALREHPGSDAVREDADRLPGPYAPPGGRIYLARHDGAPAGCVALRPLGAGAAEVKRMFVRRESRRLGIGRLLMQRLLDDARALGLTVIRLGTLEEMTAARALYLELGFTPIPRYRPDELIDTAFYECHLTAAP